MNDIIISTEKDMLAWGGRIADACQCGMVIALSGELGAGKTTLVRGFLRARGYQGVVSSPTFTIVEPYVDVGEIEIYHFDLYRLESPEELEHIGVDEYFHKDAICLVEWPQNGGELLPAIDIAIEISYQAGGKGRMMNIAALSELGERLLRTIAL